MKKNSLFFISGFAATNMVWKFQIPELQDQYLVAGSREELEEHGRAVIIAWSIGIYKAIDLYFSMKKKIKGMVFVSGSPCFAEKGDYPFGQPLCLIRNLERKIQSDLKKGMEFFYSLIFNGKPHQIFGDMPLPEKKDILGDLKYLKQVDIRDKLNEIKVPVLILHGKKDTICSIEGAKCMSEKIKNSKLVVFPCCHAPFLEKTEEFNHELKDFLENVFC